MRRVLKRAVILMAACLFILGVVPAASSAMTSGKGATALAHRAAVVRNKITCLERQVAVAHNRSQVRRHVARLGWQVVRINNDTRELTRLTQCYGAKTSVRLRVNGLVSTVAALDSRMLELCGVFTGAQARTYTKNVTTAARSLSYWSSYWRRHPAPTPAPTQAPTPSPTSIPLSTGPLNLNPPDGYVYNGGGVTSVSGTLSLGSNCTIVGVNFTSGGVRIRGNGNTIRGCTFGPNSWAALLIYVGSYNVIDGNTFNGKSGSGSCIQVLGGGHNQITNNVTHGGVTAIAFLYSRSVNGGGAASIIDGNVVSGNTCDGFSEEGITFDSLGNEPVDTGALDYDAIQSVSGSTVTLSSHAWPNYAGYYVIFMDGALQGRLDAITSVSGNSFTLANVPSGALAGNHVEIAAPFMNNEVAHNTVTGWCIKLYGLCFNNNVHDNTVNGAIEDESVDSLGAANISVTKQPGRAPNGYNTIQNNKVSGAITLEYYNIPDVVSSPWSTPFQSMGNNVIGNTCASVQADDQYCYITGNSGGTKLSNVTLSPVVMVP